MKVKILFLFVFFVFFFGNEVFSQNTLRLFNRDYHISSQLLNSIDQILINQPQYPIYKNQSGYLLDSIYIITIGSTLTRVEFFYNTFGKLSSHLHSYWDGNKWLFYSRENITYDPEGKLLTSIYESFIDNIWKPETRQSYSYDHLGRQAGYIIENYIGDEWKNSLRNKSSYDSLGNVVESISENWIDTSWIYSLKISTSYLENGLRASYLSEVWFDNKWNTDIEGVFEYDAQGNLIRTTVRQWNGTEWLNSVRGIITYENNNRTEQLAQLWDSTQWINSDRMVFSYDENDCRKNGKYEIWNNERWLPAIGPIVFEVTDEFRIGFITNEINFYYSSTTGVEDEENLLTTFKLYQNYPNPFNPTTKIKYSVPSNVNHQTSNISLKVYDALGRKVATLVNEEKPAGEYEVQFDGSGLTSGIYFYQLKAGDYVETKKLILIK
ncbi:MAG: T9SS C-terminal target domain-containing protein [Ignavibacteriales bacterium]|nr:MAG: T9SS C-terminal target domain-containing protein [Ignavibacteriales bacterium]